MARTLRVEQKGSLGVIYEFIAEGAVEDQYFLAVRMVVGGKARTSIEAHQ